jgi:hypothetical protein
MRSLTCSPAISIALALAFLGGRCPAGTITPGTPAKSGVDTFSVQDQLTGTVYTITVVITGPPFPTPAQKAAAIGAGFVTAGIPAKDVIVSGSTVKLLGFITLAGTSSAAEASALAYGLTTSDPTGPRIAILDYHLGSGSTSLSGVDASGAAATYNASLTFTDSVAGSVSLSSSLTFSQLAAPTVAALLQAEFNSLESQLLAQAPSLAGRLVLDLPNSSIDMLFPGTTTDGSVTNGTTDVSLISTESISGIPEPSGLLMFGLGVTGLIARLAGGWSRRQ